MKCGVRSCTEVKSSWLLYRPQCYWRHQSRWQTPAAFIIAVPAWSWAYWVVSLSAQLLSPRFLSRFWPTPRARHHRHETIMAKTTAVTDRHRIRTATPLRPHRRRHATTGIMGRPLAITATATELAASFKQCSNPADGPRPRQPQAHGADATTSMEFAVIFVNATTLHVDGRDCAPRQQVPFLLRMHWVGNRHILILPTRRWRRRRFVTGTRAIIRRWRPVGVHTVIIGVVIPALHIIGGALSVICTDR